MNNFYIAMTMIVWACLAGCRGTAPNTDSQSNDEVRAVASAFLEAFNQGDADTAAKMFLVSERYPPGFLADEIDDLSRGAAMAAEGRLQLKLIEVHTIEPGAVAIVEEIYGKPKPGRRDLDPMYLVLHEGEWYVLPDPNEPRAASVVLSPEEYAVFAELEQWADQRQEALQDQ